MRLLCNLIVQTISNIASLFSHGLQAETSTLDILNDKIFFIQNGPYFFFNFWCGGKWSNQAVFLNCGKAWFIYPNTFVNDSKCMDWCSPRVKTLYDNSMDLERLKTVPGLDAYESRQFCSNWETWWSHLISYYQQFCPPKFQQIQKYWWPVLNQICFFHSDSRDRQREHEDLKTLNG